MADRSPSPAVSVVVPTFEESENLPELVASVFRSLDPLSSELVVVDDESGDGTDEVARELARRYPVRCCVRHGQRGLATAVIEGIREARGEIVVVMDADLSHPPERIPALIEALRQPGVDVAVGSRFVAGAKIGDWPARRAVLSAAGRLLARPLTPLADPTSGFFCVYRERVDVARLDPIGFKILLELIVRHSWTGIVEVPISFRDRRAQTSKLGLGEQVRYLRHLARLYRFKLQPAS